MIPVSPTPSPIDETRLGTGNPPMPSEPEAKEAAAERAAILVADGYSEDYARRMALCQLAVYGEADIALEILRWLGYPTTTYKLTALARFFGFLPEREKLPF